MINSNSQAPETDIQHYTTGPNMESTWQEELKLKNSLRRDLIAYIAGKR